MVAGVEAGAGCTNQRTLPDYQTAGVEAADRCLRKKKAPALTPPLSWRRRTPRLWEVAGTELVREP